MKFLFKGVLFMMILSVVMFVGFSTWAITATIVPSFREADLNFSDLFSSDIDPEKEELFDKLLKERSYKLSESVGTTLINAFSSLLGIEDYTPKAPSAPIDYQEALKNSGYVPSNSEGLKILKDSEEKFNKGMAEGLRLAKELDERNKEILQKALNDMPD